LRTAQAAGEDEAGAIEIAPAFLFDFLRFEDAGRAGGRLATPEKALVDLLYLTPARSRLFRALPEVEWPKGFQVNAARAMVTRIGSVQRRALVSRKFEDLLKTRGAPAGPRRV
jgi:hypothetical protein